MFGRDKTREPATARADKRLAVAVRELRPTDRAAVMALEELCFDEAEAWRPRDFTYNYGTGQSGAAMLVAVVPNYATPIAGYILWRCLRCHAHIVRFAVHADYRRRGIGSLLLAFAVQRSQIRQADVAKRDVVVSVRETNLAALAFLRSAGFVATDLRGDPNAGEQSIRLIFRPEWLEEPSMQPGTPARLAREAGISPGPG